MSYELSEEERVELSNLLDKFCKNRKINTNHEPDMSKDHDYFELVRSVEEYVELVRNYKD